MSTVTYDVVPQESGRTAKSAHKPAQKGILARWMARLIANRERAAMDAIRRQGILLPHELEQAGWKITARSEDSLPFRG